MRRITELDAMRGLTALAILIYHMHPEWSGTLSRVDLFLVLSGYLTATVAMRSVRTAGDLPRHYLRRVLRIWPAYLCVLALVVVLNPWMSRPFPLDGLFSYATMTQNVSDYWGGRPPEFSGYFFHTWTLAIIEHYYLMWPLLWLLIGSQHPRLLNAVLIALLAASVASRSAGLSGVVLLGRCDGLVLGSLLAIWTGDREAVRSRLGWYRVGFAASALVAGLAMLGAIPLTPPKNEPGPMSMDASLAISASSLLYFGLLGLIVTASGHRWLAPLRHPGLVALGATSYGIYLYHPLVIVAAGRGCRALGISMFPWIDLIQVAICLVIAMGSYHLLEKPLLRLKSRIPARLGGRSPGATTSSESQRPGWPEVGIIAKTERVG